MKYCRNAITIIIPDHKELDRGTLGAFIRHTGATVDEFVAALV